MHNSQSPQVLKITIPSIPSTISNLFSIREIRSYIFESVNQRSVMKWESTDHRGNPSFHLGCRKCSFMKPP